MQHCKYCSVFASKSPLGFCGSPYCEAWLLGLGIYSCENSVVGLHLKLREGHAYLISVVSFFSVILICSWSCWKWQERSNLLTQLQNISQNGAGPAHYNSQRADSTDASSLQGMASGSITGLETFTLDYKVRQEVFSKSCYSSIKILEWDRIRKCPETNYCCVR
jgi:hypothetical protein